MSEHIGPGDVGSTVPWRTFLEDAVDTFSAAGLASPEVDARRVIEACAGHSGSEIASHLDDPATRLGVTRLETLVARRATGEPLQYVLGEWSFRTLDLFVDRRVLIPRPETEVVAGVALDELAHRRRGGHAPLVAADLGTGSGAIGLSIAAETTDVEVLATDVSRDSLAVARANLAGIGRPATRVTLLEGAWFEALPPERRGTIDVIVSNPPYVAECDSLPAEVAEWEPTCALVAGPSGTEDLCHLIDGAEDWLAQGGSLVLELAPDQAEPMAGRAIGAGFTDVAVERDLAGRARTLVAHRPERDRSAGV